METPSIKNDLIKILFDKLLLGTILVFLGVLSSVFVERYKSRTSFLNEINKIRVEKIGEVWKAVYFLESKLPEIQKSFMELASDLGREQLEFARQQLAILDQAGETMKPELHQRIENRLGVISLKRLRDFEAQHVGPARNLLNENRFWLTDEMYIAIDEYLNALVGLTHVSPGDAAFTAEKLALLDARRQTIDSVREQIFGGK